MFDHPLYFKYSPSPDGKIAALFLIFFPIGGQLFGWIGSWLCDYPTEGQLKGWLLGAITFYAFSIGFSISALRQPYKSTRIWGGVTLFADIAFLFLALPVGGL